MRLILVYYICIRIMLSILPMIHCRSRMVVLTDTRIHTMNEVVSGMRIIKMYAWERPFASLISGFRG